MSHILNIHFIGDSSTTAIGDNNVVYPRRFHKLVVSAGLNHPVRIVNYAVPGFTSADASALIWQLTQNQASPEQNVFVLYLGNNDLACGPRKGRFGLWRRFLHRWSRIFHSPSFQEPLLLDHSGLIPFDFEPHARNQLNSLFDFITNISDSIARIRKSGGRAVLVIPTANRDFLSGTGLPNAPWFFRLAKPWAMSDWLSKKSGPLTPELSLHLSVLRDMEQGRWRTALDLLERSSSSFGPLCPLRDNNTACCLFRLGQEDQARQFFERCQGYHHTYRPIFLDNLAALHQEIGDVNGASELRSLAYASDISLYRVRDDARLALKSLATQENIESIDLDDLPEATQFIDYCHPPAEGHRQLAQALFTVLLNQDFTTGIPNDSASYSDKFVSPNLFFHPTETLLQYYGIDLNIPFKTCSEHKTSAEALLASRAHRGFTAAVSRHPLFLNGTNLERFQPAGWFELLNFPEYFLYRLMAGYLQRLEESSAAVDLTHAYPYFAFTSGHYDRLILRITSAMPDPVLDYSQQFTYNIMENLLNYVQKLDSAPFDSRSRMGSIITWYTRESFRYGTHSRETMLADAWGLETILEALLVIQAVAARQYESRRISSLGAILLSTADACRRMVQTQISLARGELCPKEAIGMQRLALQGIHSAMGEQFRQMGYVNVTH